MYLKENAVNAIINGRLYSVEFLTFYENADKYTKEEYKNTRQVHKPNYISRPSTDGFIYVMSASVFKMLAYARSTN
jgi:hypothetical protein